MFNERDRQTQSAHGVGVSASTGTDADEAGTGRNAANPETTLADRYGAGVEKAGGWASVDTFSLSHFAERVRVALAASEVSPRQLAKVCDVSPQSVSKWMKGKCAPRSSHLIILARMTGANLEWLMTPSRVTIRAGAERNGLDAESMMRRIGHITGPVLHGYGGRCRKLTVSDEIATEWNELLRAIESANAERLQKAPTLTTGGTDETV